jgi:hypothetical protein
MAKNDEVGSCNKRDSLQRFFSGGEWDILKEEVKT